MAGAGKRRAKAEATASSSGEASAEHQHDSAKVSTERSSPQSLPRFDGNRDPQESAVVSANFRNISDGVGLAGCYAALGVSMPDNIPKRPAKLNAQGKDVMVALNTFNVVSIPVKAVWQYDVIIGNGAEKRGLVKAVWNSKTLQAKLGNGWLFDGSRIAWSLEKRGDVNLTIDLDAERGLQVRPDRRGRNCHRVYIRVTKSVRFDLLNGYLSRQADFSNEITEAIIFLDHLMRETPSQKYTQIKKSFFARGEVRYALGGAIEAFKGVFSSIRIATNPANKPCLSVNVDVANGTFWSENMLPQTVIDLLEMQPQSFKAKFQEILNNNSWDKSMMKVNLKRLSKLSVQVTHRGRDQRTDKAPEFVIDKILAATPQTYRIEITGRNESGEITTREWVTLADYFRGKYQITLAAGLPLVKMTKKNIVMPMDVCKVIGNQRYPFKLGDRQTSNMIRFAVTPPDERMKSIQHGLGMLSWNTDPLLQMYGLQIDRNLVKVKARQLPVPQIQFGGTGNQAHVQPNEAAKGRWMLIGKKFASKNSQPLKSWGICVIQGRGAADENSAKRFFSKFSEIYIKHGGDVVNRTPVLVPGNLQKGPEMVTEFWNRTGNAYQLRPQILFFVVPDRNSETYNRIKKLCECRYGVVSQFLQAAHVTKCQDQYISNVCMKVNAKLGGFTSRAVGNVLSKIAPQSAKIPTMCIGADVSHPPPGSAKDGSIGSFAAITMSINPSLTRYAAQCETNGYRVEMVTTANIDKILGKMVRWWIGHIGGGRIPGRVLFFRDGVSEPQYQHVIEQEVRDMKALFRTIDPRNTPQFVVIVASKRHHVRFFPAKGQGDRNNNPMPGTLVETGVTHPFQFDFYLNAHSAIKGTARPVHYTVLMNEANMSSEELQQLIFEHSFQYIRSTTPVSLFPAVYYAHLASQRARAHVDPPQNSSGKKHTEEKKETATSTSDKTPTDVQALAPMNTQGNIDFSMWYI